MAEETQTAPTTERLWTITEVADFFQVSKRTVYRWMKAGHLPVLRLGPGTTRIRQRDLDAFVEEHLTRGARERSADTEST